MNEAGRKVGLVVMLPMAVTSPQVESRVTFILSTEVLRTERRKVLAEPLTFHVGAVGGVREAAWIKEPRACCSIFIKNRNYE